MKEHTDTPATVITPEVGKRYVTRGGWVTPPWTEDVAHLTYIKHELHPLDIISEYVEATPTIATIAPIDTFRRDLIARLYVAMVGGCFTLDNLKSYDSLGMAKLAIKNADTLIKAMEEAK